MVSTSETPHDISTIDEGEIFKSLSHEIRRNIIKILGKRGKITFTDLKNEIGTIDSPTLSYHLRSLKFLVDLKNTEYFLTSVGMAALFLMSKIDQTHNLRAAKFKFLYAIIATILCWVTIEFAIPFYIAPYTSESVRITITILLNVCAQINFFIIWTLWARSWRYAVKPKLG